ncbi:hypothetical protein NliqN6_5712 [Naganishia liquefaciens]|uniref:Uncharacterized protein n=1 Tax=Naganishia liquefaciens TaxID=104408 RepID=A0A8H3TYQ6_9TREE|nr:hypothetical protein NliqN6_5712 [Naganishia liquefaciens]
MDISGLIILSLALGQVTASAASSKTSTSQTPLKTLSGTLAGGNAGSDTTVTAPDPGSTGAKNQGPGDNYVSGASRTVTTSLGISVAVMLAVAFGTHVA